MKPSPKQEFYRKLFANRMLEALTAFVTTGVSKSEIKFFGFQNAKTLLVQIVATKSNQRISIVIGTIIKNL